MPLEEQYAQARERTELERHNGALIQQRLQHVQQNRLQRERRENENQLNLDNQENLTLNGGRKSRRNFKKNKNKNKRKSKRR